MMCCLDLRADQPSYLRHVAITLDSQAANAVFVPRGIAHGFLSLTDDAVVEYLIDTPYAPALARGVRWNDPAFGIAWPAEPKVISARDNAWPLAAWLNAFWSRATGFIGRHIPPLLQARGFATHITRAQRRTATPGITAHAA
jgi:hypothetical protein